MGDEKIKRNKGSTVKPLSKELKDKVRSGLNITSVTQCVEELVYNSIDAGAKKIYVGVNLNSFKIEVDDDGSGVSKRDLEIIGRRNVTSRISSEDDLKNPQFYGYRGEALASIISVSHAVKFFTRSSSGPVYRRWFKDGKPSGSGIEELRETKRTCGLTVTVEGLLEKQPVRQKKLDSSIQLEDVKILLECIALANLNVSIEFRNEKNMAIMLKYNSCLSHTDAFDQLYCSKRKCDFNLTSETCIQDGTVFSSQVGKRMFRLKCFQFIFVNKRCIEARGKLHRMMNDAFLKILPSVSTDDKTSKIEKLFPVFILNITCSMENYCPQRDQKYSVEFYNKDTYLKGLEVLILKYQRRLYPNSSDLNIFGPVSNTKSQSKVVKKEKQILPHTQTSQKSLDQSLGLNVSTFDGKRAIRSKEVVRPSISSNLGNDENESTSSSLQSSNHSVEMHSQRQSESAMRVTYSELEDSPGQVRPVAIKMKTKRRIAKPTVTSKHTIYNVRRSKKKIDRKVKILGGIPRKDIIVPKTTTTKPKKSNPLTKDVFSSFPEWKHKSNSESDSPPPLPKKPKFSDKMYKPIDKFPSAKGKTFAFPIKKDEGKVLKKEPVLPVARDKQRDNNNTAWKIARFFCEMNNQRRTPSKRSSTSGHSQTSNQSSQNLYNVQHLDESSPPPKNRKIEDTNDTQFSTIDILLESADEFVKTNKLDGLCEEIQYFLKKDFEKNSESFIRMRDERKYVANFNEPVLPDLNFLNDHEYLNSNSSNVVLFLREASSTYVPQTSRANNTVPETPDPFGLNKIIKNQQDSQQPSQNLFKIEEANKLLLEERRKSLESHTSRSTSFIQQVPPPMLSFALSEPVPLRTAGAAITSSIEEESPYFSSSDPHLVQSSSEVIFDDPWPLKKPLFEFHYDRNRSESMSQSEYFSKTSPSIYVVEGNGLPDSSQIMCQRDNPTFQNGPETPLIKALMDPFGDAYLTSPYFPPSLKEQEIINEDKTMQVSQNFTQIFEGLTLSQECSGFNQETNTSQTEQDEDWGNWEVDVVCDSKGEEWLQSMEDEKTVFINLSTGDLSYDMINIVQKNRTTAANLTKNYRRNWLRQYFPKGCDKLWKQTTTDKLLVNGNLECPMNHLGEKVKDYIAKNLADSTSGHEKWREEAFAAASIPIEDGIIHTSSEYWNEPVNSAFEIPVANIFGPPEAKSWNKLMSRPMKFSKVDLENMIVISQWDKKFIIAKTTVEDSVESSGEKESKELLVIFDQHAVDERIRLERFINESFILDKTSNVKRILNEKIIPPWILSLNETAVRILDRYKDMFGLIGIEAEVVNGTSVKIHAIPSCLMDKVTLEPLSFRRKLLGDLLLSLIEEEVQKLLDTRSVSSSMPKTLFKILCSKACHGAIKFGDQLDHLKCETMISSLKNCNAPFQCAHGRPSVVPLLDLSSLMQKFSLSNPENVTNPHWTSSQHTSQYLQSQQSLYFSKPSSEGSN